MPYKKNLRIGVTVNLENYENLRIEVEGDISGDCSPQELINYLDEVLEKFGNNDPDTKKRVESYRRRVIQQKPAESLESEDNVKTERDEQLILPGEPDNREERENKGTASDLELKETEKSGDEDKNKETPEISLVTDLKEDITDNALERENYPDKVSESQEGIIRYRENNKIIKKSTLCEICGSAVTPQAEHASKVIAGRVLCRRCLDRMKR